LKRLWRISNYDDLRGVGGERWSARWHTREVGKRIVYLAEHPALALIETLVNLKSGAHDLPTHYQLHTIAIDREVASESVALDGLPLNWRDDLTATRQIGNEWLKRQSSALLAIPSAPVPDSTNYLLNPLHPDAANLQIIQSEKIIYDKRLFRIASEIFPEKMSL